MNELYVRMCKDSPAQKEWRDGEIDKDAIWIYEPKVAHVENMVWLPRQEDWQDILYSDKKKHNCFNTKFFNFYNECTNTITSQSLKEFFTILWCLFVHKEVYGLKWEWKLNKWVSV